MGLIDFWATCSGGLFVFKVLLGIPLSALFLCAEQTPRTFRSDSHAEAIPGIFLAHFHIKGQNCACASCIVWGVLSPRPSSCKYFCKYFYYIVLMGCKQSVRGVDRSVWLHHLHQCRCVGWVSVLLFPHQILIREFRDALWETPFYSASFSFSGMPSASQTVLEPLPASGWHKYLCGMWAFSSPPPASSPQYYFQGGNSTLTYLKITTTKNKPKQRNPHLEWLNLSQ